MQLKFWNDFPWKCRGENTNSKNFQTKDDNLRKNCEVKKL